MEYLNELYKCHRQIERELKLIGRCRGRSQPKRLKTATTGYRIKEFESRLLRLKGRWGGIISNVFHVVSDLGIYDKIAYDLTKSFLTFHDKYDFDSDELSYAFRCTILPVMGQMLDEEELGKKSHERQERRKYLLSKLLNCVIPELNFVRAQQETPSLDGSIDVCSESLVDEPDPERPEDETQEESKSQSMATIKPSPLTVLILDILVEATGRHSKLVTQDDFSASDRIYHVMNMTFIVELLRQYFNELRIYLEENSQHGIHQNSNLDLLVEPMNSYERKFWINLDLFSVSNQMILFRHQLDLLLFQLRLIKPMMKK